MLWADLISAGTAEGRSSGSILILLALHRPTMQPSHLPTLPVQRHMSCPNHFYLFMPTLKPQLSTPRPAGPCRRGVSIGGGETLVGLLLFPVSVKDVLGRPKSKVSDG